LRLAALCFLLINLVESGFTQDGGRYLDPDESRRGELFSGGKHLLRGILARLR
jgi:hypothetical protein